MDTVPLNYQWEGGPASPNRACRAKDGFRNVEKDSQRCPAQPSKSPIGGNRQHCGTKRLRVVPSLRGTAAEHRPWKQKQGWPKRPQVLEIDIGSLWLRQQIALAASLAIGWLPAPVHGLFCRSFTLDAPAQPCAAYEQGNCIGE